MIKILLNKWILLCIRVAVGVVFIYAGILKLNMPGQFADSIASFQVLPNALINIMAVGLPPTEVLAGMMMIFGWRYQIATLFILFATLIFAFAIAQALLRGLQIDCGCFGSGTPSTVKTWFSLGRDLLIFLTCLLVYIGFLKSRISNSREA